MHGTDDLHAFTDELLDVDWGPRFESFNYREQLALRSRRRAAEVSGWGRG